MMTETLKNAFWAAVADCLAEFFGRKPAEAKLAVYDLRSRIENPPDGLASDLVYHSEPIHVAANVAGEEIDFAASRDRYNCILSRHFGDLGGGFDELTEPRIHPRRRFG